MDNNNASRRQFLRTAGGTLGAAWLGTHWPELAVAAQHAHTAAAGGTDHKFRLLTAEQARDVGAIAAQIVPSGETPGAREAGVVYFIDQVQAGVYASAAPAFLAGLAEFQSDFSKSGAGPGQFADLSGSEQLSYLKGIETTPFFGTMRFLTVLGLLSLPSYGGNEGKAGWKLVGFVDQHVWEPPFGHYDRRYPGFEPYARERRG